MYNYWSWDQCIEMKLLLKHGITRCSKSMLWVSCIEMTWLIIHMKYNRYTSYFTGLVHINLVVISTWQLHPMHICMLHVGRWCWYTNFAYYSCCIQMTLIVYAWISFLLVSADQIWVAMRVHISLAVVLILIIFLLNSDLVWIFEGLERGPTYLWW